MADNAKPHPGPVSRPTRKKYALFGIAVVAIVGAVFWLEVYPYWMADRQLQRAKMALREFDFSTAEDQLRDVLKLRPDQSEASYLLAQLYRRTERPSEARKQLKEAKSLGWIPEYVKLEEMLLSVQERGPYSEDAGTVRLYINASHPEDRLLLEALTQGLLKAHMMPDAANLLDRWCERYPEDWYPRFLRGEVRESMLLVELALEDYRAVLQKNPSHPLVRRRIGDILLNARTELPEALSLFEEHLKRFPNDSDAEAGYASTLHALGRTDEALDHATTAIRLSPKSSRALLAKAFILRSRDPQAAYDLAIQAESIRFDETATPLLLGQLASELGKAEASQKHLERHRVLETQWKRLNDLSREVRLKPHDPDVRCQIGVGLIELGRTEDGVMWFHSALNENPRFRRAHELLAEHYERARTAPELARYHRSLAQQPANPAK